MKSPKLDPQIRALLEAMEAQGGRALETMTIEEARQSSGPMAALAGDPEALPSVENLQISTKNGSLAMRVYTPTLADAKDPGSLPGLVFFHGGGWVIGSLESHDATCRKIANRSGAVIVAVDYRLSPETKFPGAIHDAFEATQWVADNASKLGIDPHRLAVGGDSCGGNLATVTAMRCRDEGGPSLALQVMVYPVTNLSATDTESYREFAEDHFLTKVAMDWFRGLYLNGPEDARSPWASPLLASNLRGLPPALLITAECDPLRDEGEAYGARLQEAGVPVTISRYAGMIHPFFAMSGVIDGARKAVDEVAAAIRSMKPALAASQA